MNATIALSLAIAAIMTSGAAKAEVQTAHWHVEVREARYDRTSDKVDPKAGSLVAQFDLDQNGLPVRAGESIPYVDPESVIFPANHKDGEGFVRTLTLKTGLEVRIDGTAEAPVLHAKDVTLLGFYQQMAAGTFVTLPQTSETKLDTPMNVESVPSVVGGYTKGAGRDARVRFYVVNRL